MTELLYFTADFCGVCSQQKPVIEEIEEETNINVKTIDVEENAELANQYNVQSLPQMVLKENDQVEQKFTGLTHKHKIVEAANPTTA